jgi:hypothetical protein
MGIDLFLWTLFLLQVKHLIIDWCWQPKYEWSNKGTYGHFGGIRHAGKNAIGTGLALYIGLSGSISIGNAFVLALLDFVIHYHVDWSKMSLNAKTGWGPLTHPQFWWLTGFDQFLHQITYIGLLVIANHL